MTSHTIRSWVRATIAAGVAGGVLVEGYLFAVGLAAWPGVYQWVASAVTGEVAYSSVRYAWLGLAMHSGISLWWAGVYGGLATRLPALRTHPTVSGPSFGLMVFTLMQLAQWINGTWVAPEAAALAHYLVDHAFFFGLPVAMTYGAVADRGLRRTPGLRLKPAA